MTQAAGSVPADAALSRIGPVGFAFLTPAFGVLLGGLLLNEPLSIRIFAALALIAAGLTAVNRPARRTLPR